jgi:hypothetical protein
MVALPCIRLKIAGGALVALVNQMSVLPEETARLNAPRVMNGANQGGKERCEKAFGLAAESGGAGRPEACRRK